MYEHNSRCSYGYVAISKEFSQLYDGTSHVIEISRVFLRLFEVIWSSEKAHTVDALAARGDEGRGSLR